MTAITIDHVSRSFGTVRAYAWVNPAATGGPVVLLAGRGSGVPMWSENLSEMLKHRTVYALDAIGDAGMSTQSVPITDAADQAEWIDDVTGDLSKTAFGEISATDANNKVFFVASADNKTNTDGTENRSLWYKVKVTRSGNGYKVEYGKVEDTTPKTVEITKDPIYSFIGLSLETGEQVLQRMDTALGEDLLVRYAETQVEHGNGVLVRGLHGLGHTHRRRSHAGVVNGKTVQ